MTEIEVGRICYWKTGFYGGEQGSPGRDNWWPQTKKVRIVQIQDGRALVEILGNLMSAFPDPGYKWSTREKGERKWAKLSELELSSAHEEKP